MDRQLKEVLLKGTESPRLLLRPLRLSDAEDMFSYTRDPETCRFLKWGPHREINEAKAFIEKTLEKYKAPKDVVWGIVLKETGGLAGVLRLFDFQNDSAEISYILSRQMTGKGYMTEAVKAALDVCFMKLNRQRVIAHFVEGNEASKRVMERCGMSPLDCAQTTDIKGKTYPLYTYCLDRRDWL